MPDGSRYEFSKLVEHLLRCWLQEGAKIKAAKTSQLQGVALTAVQADVVSALVNLKCGQVAAEQAVRAACDSSDFDTLFRAALRSMCSGGIETDGRANRAQSLC